MDIIVYKMELFVFNNVIFDLGIKYENGWLKYLRNVVFVDI